MDKQLVLEKKKFEKGKRVLLSDGKKYFHQLLENTWTWKKGSREDMGRVAGGGGVRRKEYK